MTDQEKDDAALPTVVETEATQQDTASVYEPEPSAKQADDKPRRSLTAMLVLIVMLVVIAAMAVGGWWAWQQIEQKFDQLSQQQQQLSSTQQQFKLQTEQQIVQLQAQEQQIEQGWQQAVAELEALVVASAQRMNRQANRSDQRWSLEEALTLTRLAQQRLQLDASAQVALGLLAAADKVLASHDQAAVLPIRRQLASDMLALEDTAAVDINGAYFELNAIADKVKMFEWLPKPTLTKAMSDDVELAQGFWHSLKQVVVISRQEMPFQAPALQSDFEQWRQQMLLLLQQTQLALLARNQPLYDAALEQTRARLAVMASQLKTDVLETRLQTLSSAVLNPTWPEITASIEALQSYLAEQVDEQADSATEAQ